MRITNVEPHEPNPQTRPKRPNPEPKVQRCTPANSVQNRTLRQPAIVHVQPRRVSPSPRNARRGKDFNHNSSASSTQIITPRNSRNESGSHCNKSIFWTILRKTAPPQHAPTRPNTPQHAPTRPNIPRCPTQPQSTEAERGGKRRIDREGVCQTLQEEALRCYVP